MKSVVNVRIASAIDGNGPNERNCEEMAAGENTLGLRDELGLMHTTNEQFSGAIELKNPSILYRTAEETDRTEALG
jgi:hypothetical protein